MAKKHTNPSFRREAHLHLAMLYSDYRNPSPDYPKARQEIETFLSLSTEEGSNDQIRNLAAMLREIGRYDQEVKKLKAKNDQLSKENREIRDNAASLEKQNREMKDTIEKLQLLEIQIEEKRIKRLK